jgi:polyphosphate kinase
LGGDATTFREQVYVEQVGSMVTPVKVDRAHQFPRVLSEAKTKEGEYILNQSQFTRRQGNDCSMDIK